MPFPPNPAILTQSQALNAITEAEAGISQCMADFYCNTLLAAIGALTEVQEQVELFKSVMCSMSKKETAMSHVIDAIANKTLADKGLVPGGNGNNDCGC